jgi:hypothetical protein
VFQQGVFEGGVVPLQLCDLAIEGSAVVATGDAVPLRPTLVARGDRAGAHVEPQEVAVNAMKHEPPIIGVAVIVVTGGGLSGTCSAAAAATTMK